MDEALPSDGPRVYVELSMQQMVEHVVEREPHRNGAEERIVSEGREQQDVIESAKRSGAFAKRHNWDGSSEDDDSIHEARRRGDTLQV